MFMEDKNDNVIVKILGSKLHQNSRCELLACQVTFQLEMQELVVEMDSQTGSFSPCDTELGKRYQSAFSSGRFPGGLGMG